MRSNASLWMYGLLQGLYSVVYVVKEHYFLKNWQEF